MLALLACCICADACAGVSTDGSLGHPAQALSGPNYLIPQSLGLLSGSNLFQSFLSFSLNSGESANFTTSTSGIANVISRVTGGGLSQINGQISLTPCSGCGAPNFVFINPAGITFGAGATINVPGAFHASTADYVKLPGGNFYADLSKASTLSVAAPEAFGFLGTSRAAITVNGGASLQTQPGQPISLIAGDVTLDNGVVSTMSGGDIRVAAVGQAAQEVALTGALPAATGNLNILNGGAINADTATAATAGSVYVSAGNISIDGNASVNANGISTLGISSTTSTPGNGGNAGNVNVMASGNISLTNGGVISADTYSGGSAGAVTVTAASITVDGSLASGSGAVYYSSRISSQTNGDSTGYFGSVGNAGAVTVNATGAILIKNSGAIDADSNTLGNAGPVTIDAGSITVDAQGTPGFKGILSDANSSTGNAGNISVTSAGNLSVINGGNIAADTVGSGNAGNITIRAASVTVDGQANGNVYTGIWSEADFGTGNAGNISLMSTGNVSVLNGAEISAITYTSANAGSVSVTAAGNLSIANGAQISASSYGSGNAGPIRINAGSINLDGQGNSTSILSDTYSGAGNAGVVSITTSGNLSLVDGGGISSSTAAAGNAGSVTINAASVNIDGQGNGSVYTGIASSADSYNGNTGPIAITGNAGAVSITAAGNLSIVNGGHIAADTHTTGDAGVVVVNAGSITMDGQGYNGITDISSNVVYGTGQGGSVTVTATGNISIVNAAQISAATFASGNAGSITVNAGSINIDGQGNIDGVTGIFSDASQYSTGNAGVLHVASTGAISIVNGGIISTSTASSGNAGATIVSAGSISVDGMGNDNVSTGFFSDAFSGSTGNAGSLNVTTTGNLFLTNYGQISTATAAVGNAGSITVNSGSINIDGKGNSGLTGIFSGAFSGSSGNAGAVNVTTSGNLSVVNGAWISSSTSSSGNGGNTSVNAGSITIDGAGNNNVVTGIFSDTFSGSGNAGIVSVSTTGNLSLLNGGRISSSTSSAGDAGAVMVNAGSINIDGQGNSGVSTGILTNTLAAAEDVNAQVPTGSSTSTPAAADSAARGNAGTINITNAGNLSIVGDGSISSSTFTSGKAGAISVDSGTLSIDGSGSMVVAAAFSGSAGQTGTVSVTAANAIVLSNNGRISIANNAIVADPTVLTPTSISVTAPTINIVNSPIAITAWSTGNVDAGSIKITSADGLFLTTSGIYTTAVNGNGGSIVINADLISLDSSQITAVSNFGVGGNIDIVANSLVMNTGYILAYAPTSLVGGNISIDVPNLIASGNTLFVGHANIPFQPDVFGLNVIQATGAVQTSSPALDIAGSLIGLNTKVIDSGGLGRSPCQITGGSSLALTGQGGLAPSARGLLRAELPVAPSGIGIISSHGDAELRLAASRLSAMNWGCN